MLHETFYPLFHGTQAAIIKNGNDFYTTKRNKAQITREHKKFLKNCQRTSYALISGQRTFFSIIFVL